MQTAAIITSGTKKVFPFLAQQATGACEERTTYLSLRLSCRTHPQAKETLLAALCQFSAISRDAKGAGTRLPQANVNHYRLKRDRYRGTSALVMP